jgi:hypothetical protein
MPAPVKQTKVQVKVLAKPEQEQVKVLAKPEQAVSLVLIETNGTLKTLKAKEVSLDTLYKKCGFRVNDDFLCRHTWNVSLPCGSSTTCGSSAEKEQYIVSLWAKKTGKANFENKYDLPPPLDKELFFGTCALVRTKAPSVAAQASAAQDGTLLDLTKEKWLKIYEQLFGGFEDIGDEDEFSEDELANVDPALLTKDGYLKDDFVVSDKETISEATSANVSVDDSEESVGDSEDDDDDEEIVSVSKSKSVSKPKKTPVAIVAKKKNPKKSKVVEEPEETSELEEEVYTFSDEDD